MKLNDLGTMILKSNLSKVNMMSLAIFILS